MSMAVLFQFSDRPELTESRLAAVRDMNPAAPTLGLYSEPRRDVERFRGTTSRLDDLWLHREGPPEWACAAGIS